MTNVVTNPRVWKRKAILIKAESQTGTDAGPTAASNWIEARNVSFQSFDVETVERNIEQQHLVVPTGSQRADQHGFGRLGQYRADAVRTHQRQAGA